MTISSRLVGRISVVKAGNIAVVIFSSLMFLNFVVWSVASHGFDRGYETARTEFEVSAGDSSINLNLAGPRTYEGLADDYYFLAVLALLITLIGFIRSFAMFDSLTVAFGSANSLFLLLVMNLVWFLIKLKDPAMNASLDSPYNALALYSVTFDWLSLGIAGSIVLIEVGLLANWFRNRIHEKVD